VRQPGSQARLTSPLYNLTLTLSLPLHLTVSADSSSSSSAAPPPIKKPRKTYNNDATVIYFKSDKANGFSFLSNFWPDVSERSFLAVSEAIRDANAAFTVDGVTFKTVEHFFQHAKYKKVNAVAAEEIRTAPTALDAKKTNTKWKRSQPIDVAAWELDGEATMLAALRAKFKFGTELARALVATGTRRLVEVPGRSKDRWAGDDGLMSKLLAQVRDELIQKDCSSDN
jgi:predicted NAD-dependent protein-ADP-ribosyltransferase YbiA (DUF1768 family)